MVQRAIRELLEYGATAVLQATQATQAMQALMAQGAQVAQLVMPVRPVTLELMVQPVMVVQQAILDLLAMQETLEVMVLVARREMRAIQELRVTLEAVAAAVAVAVAEVFCPAKQTHLATQAPPETQEVLVEVTVVQEGLVSLPRPVIQDLLAMQGLRVTLEVQEQEQMLVLMEMLVLTETQAIQARQVQELLGATQALLVQLAT